MGFKNTLLPVASSLSSDGRLLDLSKPLVMGILKATPDSFFTGTLVPDETLRLAEKMVRDGAAILDIGGASSRPGAAYVSAAEEMDRVLPVIEAVASHFPGIWMSVDTPHASVAEAAVQAGVHIINDITAGRDTAMLDTVARLRIPYIAMHMQGSPHNMQDAPVYTDVVQEVFDYLKAVMLKCKSAGIHDLILDPGFGFGKTVAHNYDLLNELGTFRALGRPVLAGISRKSMICKPLGVNPERALNGTTALHTAALREGASILRAHDVKEAVETIALYSLLVN